MDIFRNHTVVLLSMKSFFAEVFSVHGLCIFGQSRKDAVYLAPLGTLAIILLVVVTACLALLRYLSDRYLCPHLGEKWGLKPEYRLLLPETLWKAVWSFVFVVWTGDLVLRKYPYFFRAETVWFAENSNVTADSGRGAWKPGMPVPWDLAGVFWLLLAFYAHGLFALYFQDRDRDFDYAHHFTRTRICALHHAATLSLTYIALVVPYVRIGVVVVFICHWCEFLLESMKVFNYIKDQRDESQRRVFGYVSTGLLITLTISWIWLKLHLFVTKVLYMAFPLLMGLKSGWIVNLYFPFSSLLNFALVAMWMMNWFWFVYLMKRFLSRWRATSGGGTDVSKADADNVANELFSRFSSFHGWYIFDDDDDY